jgi:hypothetical protein
MPTVTGPSHIVASVIVKGTLATGGSNAIAPSINLAYRWTSGPGIKSKLALSNAFEAGPYAAMLAAFNVAWANGTTNIRFLDDVTDPTLTTVLAGVGAIATDRLPSTMAVYFFIKSNVRGRRAQGSKHFAAASEIDTTGDILVAGLARWTAIATAMVLQLTDANADIWTPCIVSKKSSQIRFTPERVVYNDIAQIVVNQDIGIMRKRKVARVV